MPMILFPSFQIEFRPTNWHKQLLFPSFSFSLSLSCQFTALLHMHKICRHSNIFIFFRPFFFIALTVSHRCGGAWTMNIFLYIFFCSFADFHFIYSLSISREETNVSFRKIQNVRRMHKKREKLPLDRMPGWRINRNEEITSFSPFTVYFYSSLLCYATIGRKKFIIFLCSRKKILVFIFANFQSLALVLALRLWQSFSFVVAFSIMIKWKNVLDVN